MQQIMVY